MKIKFIVFIPVCLFLLTACNPKINFKKNKSENTKFYEKEETPLPSEKENLELEEIENELENMDDTGFENDLEEIEKNL